MTIRKLTVAAAIAVGIATCSFNAAMAACPCEQQPIVSQTPCGCNELPVVTGAACPCDQKPEPCGCDVAPQCPADPVPSCALCPSTKDLSRDNMKQVYAYPNGIYGYNNYVGTTADSVYSSEGFSINRDNSKLSAGTMGTTVATDGSITGAAAHIPCLNELTQRNGVPIIRDEARMDGMGCPIQMGTSNSIQAIKKSLVPFDLSPFSHMSNMTGAAAGMQMQMFPDVPNGYWAACEIDKLATNDVVVGYPDRMFKPSRTISRAEFATMLIKGFDRDMYSSAPEKIFSDVPTNHWANSAITAAVHQDLLKGYPNGTFMPSHNVTRAEALCALAKGVKCSPVDKCKAQEILSQYTDGNTVPEWAQIPLATALEKGALDNSPNPKTIAPFKDATRADIAAMLQNIRVNAGIDKNPVTANNDCPICPVDKKAFVENEELVKIPTLQLEFKDQVTAKSSHVGQRFAAKTLEDVTINGHLYPCGSNVHGKVVEVIRPSGCQKGALKLAFTDIENCGCKATLPRQILTAQIDKSNTPNIVSRLVTAPFTWAGSIVGIVGRTTGGMLTSLGNAVEDVSSGTGIALGEVLQGQLPAAGRSAVDVVKDTVKAPIDFTRTALSGTMGLFQTTGDEVAYLVDAKGYKISAINPKEHVTIAFGCSGE
ncbi:MAG: S-layer homology domain-containing protein [Candidatus Gastranaerophilales bacterium]|nr:S-layer homology domain-containing protein [Candidatus Gastranaerophilales bacterium]MCM1073644.1 S-layer homology domain-containing protein [Bacteroides sp.]